MTGSPSSWKERAPIQDCGSTALDNGKQLVQHSQSGQNDGYQVYVLTNATFGSVFLYQTDGKPHQLLVE